MEQLLPSWHIEELDRKLRESDTDAFLEDPLIPPALIALKQRQKGIPSILISIQEQPPYYQGGVVVAPRYFNPSEVANLVFQANQNSTRIVPPCWLPSSGKILLNLRNVDKSAHIVSSLEMMKKECLAQYGGFRHYSIPFLTTEEGLNCTIIAIFGQICVGNDKFLLGFSAYDLLKSNDYKHCYHYPFVKFPVFSRHSLKRYEKEPEFVCMGELQAKFSSFICDKNIEEALSLLKMFLITR